LVVVTPVGLALLVMAGGQAVRRGWRDGQDRWNFAAAFSLPLFGLFFAASFKTDVHMNWTAPAFLALLPAASALWWTAIDRQNPRWRWWRTGSWIVGCASVAVVVAGHFTLATGQPKIFAYSRAGGWRALAREVAAMEKQLAERTGRRPFIIGADKYNIAAELGFYLQRPADCLNEFALGRGGIGYRYWADLEKLRDRPAVIVIFGDKAKTKEAIARHFATLGEPHALPVGTHGKKSRQVYLIVGLKYRPFAEPTEADLD
jgi:dolichol-phosphate mannosyltransferase